MSDEQTHCIGLMGYPGAGKSYAASCLGEHLGVEPVAIGDVVRENAKEALGKNAGSDEIGNWVTEQLEEDEQAINSWVIDHIRERPDADYAVIDGIRTPSDVEVFTNEFASFSLVYVRAHEDTRLSRLQNRGRDGEENFTKDDLRERDAREDDWGVGTLVDEEFYDVDVGNDISEKFEEKLINAVDGVIFRNS